MAGKEVILYTNKNYYLILVSVLLIILGFTLMTGSGNPEGGPFNSDIYSFRRITLAPVVVLAGYFLMLAGIMNIGGKTKSKRHEQSR